MFRLNITQQDIDEGKSSECFKCLHMAERMVDNEAGAPKRVEYVCLHPLKTETKQNYCWSDSEERWLCAHFSPRTLQVLGLGRLEMF